MGAKNVLLAIRHIEFLPSVLFELLVKRFPLFLNRAVGLPKVEEGIFDMGKDIDKPSNLFRPYLKVNDSVIRTLPVFDSWLKDREVRRVNNRRLVRRQEEGFVQIPMVTVSALYRLVSTLYGTKSDTEVRISGI